SYRTNFVLDSFQGQTRPGIKIPSDGPRGSRDHCVSWQESPNLLNPYWRATLVPIDIDEETNRSIDDTPGVREKNEAKAMLRSSGLFLAARTYMLLKAAGYE